MEETRFETLLAQSNQYLAAAMARVAESFDLASYPRYDYHLRSRELWWSTPGDPAVRARITLVGTLASDSGTWLWAWANPQFEGMDLGAIEAVREFGEEEGLERLADPEWTGTEASGWEMTAIASRLLESAGAYRSPHRNGFLYLVFEKPERIPDAEKPRYLGLSRPGPETV